MKGDTPIALISMSDMTPEDREMLIIGIRDRRINPVRVYEELSFMKAEAKKERLEKQWIKQLEMFRRDLVKADKAIDVLQARSTKLRALEMEIEQL